jgi:L-threonylcarbamoyladenylate synthase
VPAHGLLRDLLAASGPLASTSANRHGQPPATSAAQVLARLGDDLDAILDGGPANGVASTIIDCATTPPRVLREGPISGDELYSCLGGSTAASAGAAPANDYASEGHQRRERHPG